MTDLHQPEDVAAYNENALEELAWAIASSVGQFKLFLARCNYTSLRSRLVDRLQELTSLEIRVLELKASDKTLFTRIQAEIGDFQPDTLMILGLESVGDIEQMLPSINQVREEFRKHFHFPLIIWINDEIYKKVLRLAADFESWATTTHFRLTTKELVDYLKKTAQQFLDENLRLSLEVCREIKLACQDIQSHEQLLDLEIQACIESLLGLTKYAYRDTRNLDKALEHYQKAAELWQQSNNLARQGQLFKNIALCYYLKALQYRNIYHPNWQATKHYIRQAIEFFEHAQRPDLVADSIFSFGIILRRLQDWDLLQTLAQKALQRHKDENKTIEIAQDYGFLAEVALAKERWSEAKDLAHKALEILPDGYSLKSPIIAVIVSELPANVISNELSRYWFIIAQSQQYFKQNEEAIHNLEEAIKLGSPEYDTQLYLDILCYLQKLYFEQKEYLQAFEIKIERQSIEQQYGLRAFVGAGRIQAQKQAKSALTQVASQENIAPEISASGRLLDVDRLLERIGRNDCKLIVIHGESGVGKSSLVNGGLVPKLKQKPIGTSDVLPVPMRVYTSWVGELGKLLAEALDLSTSLDSEAAILEQLQQSESRHLRTVLIFDQFEEFFFVYPSPSERRGFFEFVGECLKILPVKVILSLRQDYLHYLLEFDRLPSMKIIGNDILTHNVRYQLGNFSPADATSIIQRLTERTNFRLEPALINQLVQDLAGNLGEVRPIELQIVGAQLQTEDITTLDKYQQQGQKEELVKRYLAEVVSDCGADNQQVAELVLYLLTDEKGTRPLKTRAEVERELQQYLAVGEVQSSKIPPTPLENGGNVPSFFRRARAFFPSVGAKHLGDKSSVNPKVSHPNASPSQAVKTLDRLNLVFKIFVGSGLVILLPELPADRYQLVHDYLAAFIRQQQEPRLQQVMAELEQEKKQRKLGEQKLNCFLRVALVGSIVAVCGLAVLTWRAEQQRQLAQEQRHLAEQQKQLAEANEINAITNSSEALFLSERTFDSLMEALKARGKLKKVGKPPVDTEISAKATLLQAVYDLREPSDSGVYTRIREHNRLEGHSSYVLSVSFSPDGKTIASASYDNTVKLWNLEGKELKTLKGHSSTVTSVSFSPDGKTIASASLDDTVKLWNLEGKELKTLKGHSSTVTSVSFSPDGKTIASASADKTVKLWNFDFESLQIEGCNWLNDYLVTHPSDLETLEICQNPSILMAAAPFLVKAGEEQARQDNINDAVAAFRLALKGNQNLTFNPEAKAKQLAEASAFVQQGEELLEQGNIATALTDFQKALKLDPSLDFELKTKIASVLVTKGESFVKDGKIKEAISAYAEAQKLDPKIEISTDSWNSLCWDGSLQGHASDSMLACEKAVALAPDNGAIRDSRGLARAITGNTKGAIEDFQAYINSTEDKEDKIQRQRWINALRAGKNPFTPEEVKQLQNNQ
jgi:tetratricopeptide (TPR) repeat protein